MAFKLCMTVDMYGIYIYIYILMLISMTLTWTLTLKMFERLVLPCSLVQTTSYLLDFNNFFHFVQILKQQLSGRLSFSFRSSMRRSGSRKWKRYSGLGRWNLTEIPTNMFLSEKKHHSAETPWRW